MLLLDNDDTRSCCCCCCCCCYTISSKLLMIPRPVPPQRLSDVLANRTNWMLVDRSLVSFDGTQCDKVGTSFTAFRYHSDRCKRAPQVRHETICNGCAFGA
jgi:hypothetical protein